MIRLLLFLLCFIPFTIFSQKKTDTLRLYFNINEIESATNTLRLDSILKTINQNVDVGIFGYADFLSNEDYNLTLSKKRADAVKTHILSKKSSYINVYACEGKGEKYSKDNSSSNGEPMFRRVEIYFEPITEIKISEARLENPKEPAPIDKKNIVDLETGESLAIIGLSFLPGRHQVLKTSSFALKKLVKTLKENPNLKIEIQGHVCCTNNGEDGIDLDTRQKNLSVSRAKAIFDHLIDNGISKERLSYKGFGHSKPKELIENTSEKEQANRRVEIMVLER